MQKTVYVGIDPDTEKSGVATYSESILNLYNFDYFKLFEFLKNMQLHCIATEQKMLVVIEQGQQNKALFNSYGYNSRVSNSIAMNTGRNFEATNIIIKFCIHNSISYEFFVPNAKTPKLNQKQINILFPSVKKSNEEQRDAIRTILKYTI